MNNIKTEKSFRALAFTLARFSVGPLRFLGRNLPNLALEEMILESIQLFKKKAQ